jgi:selenium donor protein
MLPRVDDPALLVGVDTLDDAAVYRLTDDIALVQTVDFFTPVVDDPYDFGRIAAANAFSDIYAMGGRPLTALNIVCFPSGVLPLDYLGRILQGGAETARLAGATIVGGHTIDDPEPKYGLAVTGVLKPGDELTNAGAMPGDLLVLTKPIGTGIVATAIKRGEASASAISAATASMAALNRDGAEVAREHGVRAPVGWEPIYGSIGCLFFRRPPRSRVRGSFRVAPSATWSTWSPGRSSTRLWSPGSGFYPPTPRLQGVSCCRCRQKRRRRWCGL